MKSDKRCRCADKHEGHICELDRKGETELIQHITDEPAVLCVSCGAEANCPEYVCTPVKLN